MLYRLALPIFMYLAFSAMRSLTDEDGPATGQSHAPAGVRGKLLQWVLDSFGAGKLNPGEISILVVAMTAYSILLGHFSDMLLKDRGFGPAFNGFIVMIGACAGLAVVGRFGSNMIGIQHIDLVFVAIVCVSMLVLAAACMLKVFLIEETSAVINGDTSRFQRSPKAKTVNADRMNMVTKRRP